jgi:IclR family KDG regulon transcriptional repressor
MGTATERPTRRGESAYHTEAVSRALQILDSFTARDFELSVADLNQRLGIHKSTLVRLLHCMVAEGFIEQSLETGDYRLGIKTFEIGAIYHRTRMLNIGVLARPSMERLATTFHLSANLAVRDATQIVYVENVEPEGTPLRVAYSAGDRFGVHHTALGKALIAFLPPPQLMDLLARIHLTQLTQATITSVADLETELEKVRQCGYAMDDEESLPGLRCVGAPIWSSDKVVAALSASGSTLGVTRERTGEIAAAVVEAASAISAQLGGRHTRPE